MSESCAECLSWVVKSVRAYDDGAEVVLAQQPDGKGNCLKLNMVTESDFGCKHFTLADGFDHIITEKVAGAPWQNYKMGPCPDCVARGQPTGFNCRCAGTGKVRHYDDGFIGDEKTRKHKYEVEHERAAAAKAAIEKAKAVLAGLPTAEAVEPPDPTKLAPQPKPNVL